MVKELPTAGYGRRMNIKRRRLFLLGCLQLQVIQSRMILLSYYKTQNIRVKKGNSASSLILILILSFKKNGNYAISEENPIRCGSL